MSEATHWVLKAGPHFVIYDYRGDTGYRTESIDHAMIWNGAERDHFGEAAEAYARRVGYELPIVWEPVDVHLQTGRNFD